MNVRLSWIVVRHLATISFSRRSLLREVRHVVFVLKLKIILDRIRVIPVPNAAMSPLARSWHSPWRQAPVGEPSYYTNGSLLDHCGVAGSGFTRTFFRHIHVNPSIVKRGVAYFNGIVLYWRGIAFRRYNESSVWSDILLKASCFKIWDRWGEEIYVYRPNDLCNELSLG